jgi:hypothetical protein
MRELNPPTESAKPWTGLLDPDNAAELLGIERGELYDLSPDLHRVLTPGRYDLYSPSYLVLIRDYRHERRANAYKDVVADLARLATAQNVMQETEKQYDAELHRVGGDYGMFGISQLSELLGVSTETMWVWVKRNKINTHQKSKARPHYIDLQEVYSKFPWKLPQALDGQRNFRDEQAESASTTAQAETWLTHSVIKAAMGDASPTDIAPGLEKSGYIKSALHINYRVISKLAPFLLQLQPPTFRYFPREYIDPLVTALRADENRGLSPLEVAARFAVLDSTIELIADIEDRFTKALILLTDDQGLLAFTDLRRIIPVNKTTMAKWKQDPNQRQENKIAVRVNYPRGVEHRTDVESVLKACKWILPKGLERPE